LEHVFTTCAHWCTLIVSTGETDASHRTGAKTRKYRDETINLRASQRQKSLIDRAADALGATAPTSCSKPVPGSGSVLLDRRYFALSNEEFKRFTSMLDKPRRQCTPRGYCIRKRPGSSKRWSAATNR